MNRILFFMLSLAGLAAAQPLDLRLPTANDQLFHDCPEKFYMYVDRTFEGETSQPWEAGCFGFVRNAARINGEVILTKFHEGIDISPLKRDADGNPLDMVSSIAAGRVVHTSPIAGHSNYGKYVVVAHPWEGSEVVSLYAHLADVSVKPGDPVEAGTVLGKLGYTGAGLNRTRAHVHVELGLVMSDRFEDWFAKFSGGRNYHGNYNGMNITGTEVSRFLLEQKADPQLTFSRFVTSTPAYFKVAVPMTTTPEFVKRYPWICRAPVAGAKSWEISLTATGQPVAFEPSEREVAAPIIVSIRPSTIPHRHLTRGLVTGEGNRATLSSNGLKLIALLTDDFPVAR
jgi:murein DD-endopeptidase MepM/ murein hydrolase activator NlpD